MRRFSLRLGLPALLLLTLTLTGSAAGQSPLPSSPPATPPLSFKILVDQLTALFPAVQTDVVEVAGRRVTLASGRSSGVLPGTELVAFREGRELYHPTTKKLLGRTEEALGRLVVAEVFDGYSVATLVDGGVPRPGDKVRVPSGKAKLTILALASGPRARVVEAATYDLVQELERTGRFQVMLGDQASVWLAQEQIANGEVMRGKGVKEVLQRFKISHLLALHFTTVQGKPFVETRLFAASSETPAAQHAFFVPASSKPKAAQEFSSGPDKGTLKVERRSLLARLLSGDWEPNAYSASAAAIPIRRLATFPFIVVSMDVGVSPHDKIPRIAVTDGQRVFLYRLNNQVLEPEWTFDKRMLGQILSVQFVDADGDGVLDVLVNRQDYKSKMLGYILTTRNGKPAFLAEDLSVILLAVDEKGDGVNRTLWGQRYSDESFFSRGATRYVLRGNDVAAAGSIVVPSDFRPLGATLSTIAGKDDAVLAFVDERNRLRLFSQGQELWRSLTPVGGGLARAHLQYEAFQSRIDKFVKVEPNPISVDLDGDGIPEIVIPVNEEQAGRMAVIFKTPAGFRMQVVNSGFEGHVTGLGVIPGDSAPSLVAAVVKRTGLLWDKGETQLIMTVPE